MKIWMLLSWLLVNLKRGDLKDGEREKVKDGDKLFIGILEL